MNDFHSATVPTRILGEERQNNWSGVHCRSELSAQDRMANPEAAASASGPRPSRKFK
jgi:hypothetical protein